MLKQISISIILLIFLHSCRQQGDQSAKVRNELLALEKEAIKKEFANDTAFLSSVMDSTFIELDQKGGIKRKKAVLDFMYQHELQNIGNNTTVDSFHLSDEVVHLYNDAAVVTFIMHTFRNKPDTVLERKTRFYDVWIKRDGKWKAIAWQGSAVE